MKRTACLAAALLWGVCAKAQLPPSITNVLYWQLEVVSNGVSYYPWQTVYPIGMQASTNTSYSGAWYDYLTWTIYDTEWYGSSPDVYIDCYVDNPRNTNRFFAPGTSNIFKLYYPYTNSFIVNTNPPQIPLYEVLVVWTDNTNDTLYHTAFGAQWPLPTWTSDYGIWNSPSNGWTPTMPNYYALFDPKDFIHFWGPKYDTNVFMFKALGDPAPSVHITNYVVYTNAP